MAELLAILKRKQGSSDTRQAVVQIFDRLDLKPGNGDVPCTTTLQFLPRKGNLHMIATMRSNDVYRGFPSDIFAFTFIQEVVARTLGLEVGTYSHFVGSLHLYDDDQPGAHDYLNEGFQAPISMPAMPEGDPSDSIAWLLEVERAIRLGQPEPPPHGIGSYWLDLSRLLRIKMLYRNRNMRELVQQKSEMASPVYDAFIRGRQVAAMQRPEAQPDLPGIPVATQEKKTA